MPMDLRRYPANWKQISQRIRFERAGGVCEWCGAAHGQPHPTTRSTVVLTVAHIGVSRPDGSPGDKRDKMDVRDENLAALCQRCHLTFDRDEHAINAAATRHRRQLQAGQKELDMNPDQILPSATPKEGKARRLLTKLLPDDSQAADLWPADDVYEFLEADGYAWDVNEWIVLGGGSAWEGFDDTNLVPSR